MPVRILRHLLTSSQLLPVFSRRLCSLPPLEVIHELDTGFNGTLKVAAAGDVNIKETDPHSPNPGRVLIGCRNEFVRSRRRPQYWSIYSPLQNEPLTLDVPIPFNLDVVSTCATYSEVNVSNLENESVSVKADVPPNDTFLEVCLKKIKSNNVFVRSNNLKFAGVKSIIQHLSTTSSNLEFFSDRIHGEIINIDSDRSRVDIQSLYCRHFFLRCIDGHINIGSAHGILDILVSNSGSVKIGSLEGSLTLKLCYGDLNLHLTKPHSVLINVAEGSVDLSLPALANEKTADGSDCVLDVTASEISPDADLALANRAFPHSPTASRLITPVRLPLCPTNASCVVKVGKGEVKLKQQEFSNVFSFNDNTTIT